MMRRQLWLALLPLCCRIVLADNWVVARRIALPVPMQGLSVDPGAERVFASAWMNREARVFEIDAVRGRVLREIRGLAEPHASAATDPDGRFLFVPNLASGTWTRHDRQTGTFRHFRGGDRLGSLARAGDALVGLDLGRLDNGRRDGASALLVIRGQRQPVPETARLELPLASLGWAEAMVPARDGTSVFVGTTGHRSGRRLACVALATGEILAEAVLPSRSDALGDHAMDLSPDGKTLFCVLPEGRLMARQASDLAPLWERRIGRRPLAVAVSPDGNCLAVADAGRDGLLFLDAHDGTPQQERLGICEHAHVLAWLSPRRLVASGRLSDGVLVMERGPEPVPPPAPDVRPTDRERTELWVVSGSELPGQQNDLFLFRPDGTLIRRLTSAPESEVCVAISPDGEHIAFLRNGREGWEPHVIHPDGTGEQCIADAARRPKHLRHCSGITWLSDRRLAYARGDVRNQCQIVSSSLDDPRETILVNAMQERFLTPVSRPGHPNELLLCYCTENWSYFEEVWLYDWTTHTRRVLIPNENRRPSLGDISPDGRWAALTRTRGDIGTPQDLWLYDLETGKGRLLARTPCTGQELGFGRPRFSPDGTQVITPHPDNPEGGAQGGDHLRIFDLATGTWRRVDVLPKIEQVLWGMVRLP